MKTVDYEFEIDWKVITPFGEQGVITMLAYDDGGEKYYVQTKSTSGWFKEKQLKDIDQPTVL